MGPNDSSGSTPDGWAAGRPFDNTPPRTLTLVEMGERATLYVSSLQRKVRFEREHSDVVILGPLQTGRNDLWIAEWREGYGSLPGHDREIYRADMLPDLMDELDSRFPD